MKMSKVQRCNQVVTPRNQQILDLAAMLSISIGIECIDPDGQYIYLESLSTSPVQMVISSQLEVHAKDVVISEEIFTEILIDAASGIPVKDAMFKQNILVRY